MNQKDGGNSLLIHRRSDTQRDIVVEQDPGMFHQGVTMHGETVFSAIFFSIGTSMPSLFLLTGSEDCTSRISLCREARLIDSVPLTPQESCVRAVCASQVDDSSALLVVGGGKLTLQFFLARTNDDTKRLRSVDDLEISFLGNGSVRLKASIDHRINAVKAIPLEGDSRVHLVMAGDSNGNCHIFLVTENLESRPAPGLMIPTSPRPVLCIDILRTLGRLCVVIGTTGGDVLLFDLPGSFIELSDQWDEIAKSWTALASYQAHQMGTNALSVDILSSTHSDMGPRASLLVCTGGDDQAVCICEVSLVKDEQGRLKSEHDLRPQVTKEASFSAMKGIFQFCNDGGRYIVTVGYSQQLAVWQYVNKECRQLQLTGRIPVDLGDVNCLAATSTSGSHFIFAIGGLGIETFGLR
jgi:hypothetical protein